MPVERRARLRRALPVRTRPRAALLTAHRALSLQAPAPADRDSGALGRANPHKRLYPVSIGVVLAALAGLAVAMSIRSASIFYLLYITVLLIFGAIALTTLVWMLHAWRTPEAVGESRLGAGDLRPANSFSLIVPARHEEAVLEATLSRLVMSDHPAFQVLVVVGADDPATHEVASAVAGRHPELVRVIVDASWPKNKPRALNAALQYCTGTVTGVFDAEDLVHPELLLRIDSCFQETDADVVQAGVQLMNFRSSWLTVRNVLEYYFWFRSRLHLHARQRFIPLGGNTVFIRTELLRAVGGWDRECLAEDCELGVRLSSFGAQTVVVYEPGLVTREECPPTVAAFTRQRTRWNQGYLQTLLKGCWRRLPAPQRALGVYILAMPYLLAVAWLMIPVAIVTVIAVKAPTPIALVSFVPVLPMLSMLAVEVLGLGDFCRVYGERASPRDYVRVVLGLPLYQLVLAFAAARAVVREVRGRRLWEKTAHLGLHLTERLGDGLSAAAGSTRVGSRRRMRCEGRIPTVAQPPRRLRAADDIDELRAPAAGRLPRRLLHPFDTIDVYGEALRPRRSFEGFDHDVLRAQPATHPHLRGASGGNGHGAWSPRLARAAALGGQPPPALDGVGANGSVSHSAWKLHPVRGPRVDGAWLERLASALRRVAASHADVAMQALLLAGIGVVTATNMLHWPDTGFDEGTYIGNAWAVQHGALSNYTYGYGHPPLAWLLIFLWTRAGAIVARWTFSIDTGRELMFVVTLVSCSLLYTLARRLDIGRLFAASAVILFALSPVAVFYHRQVLLDNPAVAFALAAFVLARTPQRRLWAFAASGACFAASVLSKETTLILLPAVFWSAAQNTDRRTRRYCLTLFTSFFVLIALAYPLYATLKGELIPGRGHVSLIGEAIVQLFGRQGTGSLFDPHSQTHAIVAGWLHLDPWLLGAGIALLPIALARRDIRPIALALLLQVVTILRPGYLPNMYVLGLLPFAALIVAGTADALWRFASGTLQRRVGLADRDGGRFLSSFRASATSWAAASGSALALCGLVAGAVVYVAPGWVATDRAAMTSRQDGPRRAAERWLVQHIGHDKRLIVSDDFWIYLIEHGFDHHAVRGGFYSRTVVFYWTLDYDPAVKRRFPRGWRDFDYVVSVQGMRDTLNQTPTVAAALAHSRIVASFGRGVTRIEIRAIDRAAPSV